VNVSELDGLCCTNWQRLNIPTLCIVWWVARQLIVVH